MSVKRGPMIEQFAGMIDCKVDEVVEWANQYISLPRLANSPEPTEQERTDSIKGYISMRVNTGATGRIRASIAEEKRIAA